MWESIWRFGHNTQFAYGGWAERQRCVITAFFFPPLSGMAAVTEMPKNGQKRYEREINLYLFFISREMRIQISSILITVFKVQK